MTEAEQLVWNALPGPSVGIVYKTRLSLYMVRKILKAWLAEGKVARSTSWHSRQGYTWIYKRAEG